MGVATAYILGMGEKINQKKGTVIVNIPLKVRWLLKDLSQPLRNRTDKPWCYHSLLQSPGQS